jgi:heme exporter protein C
MDLMKQWSGLWVLVLLVMFTVAPILIAVAPPHPADPGLEQRIFYYHVPSAMMMFLAAFTCGIASAVYLFKNDRIADRLASAAGELTVIFGLIVLVTGPIWARRRWGHWWEWDARLTLSLLLWMVFLAYLLVRRYGGPGAAKLSSAVAIFGMANVPFVYISVNIWRTLHPQTSYVPSLPPGDRGAFWFAVVAFLLLYSSLLAVRMRLEGLRNDLDILYLQADQTESCP